MRASFDAVSKAVLQKCRRRTAERLGFWKFISNLTLTLTLTLSQCRAYAQAVTAVRAGRIVTLAGPDIYHGVVLMRNGKIIAVGAASTVKIPQDANVIDASSRVVMPGLVCAFSTLAGASENPGSISPDIRASDGFDFFAKNEKLLRGGLTTVYVATTSRRLVSGQGGIIKLAGSTSESRTLIDCADVRVALGEVSKNPPAIFRPAIPPTTNNPLLPAQRQLVSVRPAEFAILRQLFADARYDLAHPTAQVHLVGVGASDASSHMAERRVKLQPVIAVVQGHRPVRIQANSVADIRLALQFSKEENVKIVLEGAAEGGKIASELAVRGVPVVASTPAEVGRTVSADFERDNASGTASVHNLAEMARAGVKIALMPASDSDLGDLLLLAAAQTACGVPRDIALRSVTSAAAQVLGIDRRVGTLAPGRDADLLVLSGDPLATTTHVDETVVSGKVVFQRTSTTSDTAGLTAIRAGRIYTVSHGIIENGIILMRDGKIAAVSADGVIPSGVPVIDAAQYSVMPGMIDCYSFLGLHADSLERSLEPASSASGSISARTPIATAIRANDPALNGALAGGVTAVLLAPPAASPMSGTAALIKPIDVPDRVDAANAGVVKQVAALCFNMQGGSPRMAQPWVFEDLLQAAKQYNQRRIQYLRDYAQWEHDRDEAKKQKKDAPTEPAEVVKDEDQEPFAALFRGEVPAFVHASRVDEILNALKVFKDENDLSLTLVGASDSVRVAEEIRKRNANVALAPEILKSEKGATVDLPASLSAAGVHVMLEGSSNSGTQLLRLNAANAVRNGMDPAAALRAVTLLPAESLNVQNRLGSIDAGKDADLVILSGDPLELTSVVEKVLVNGKVVYDVNKKQ